MGKSITDIVQDTQETYPSYIVCRTKSAGGVDVRIGINSGGYFSIDTKSTYATAWNTLLTKAGSSITFESTIRFKSGTKYYSPYSEVNPPITYEYNRLCDVTLNGPLIYASNGAFSIHIPVQISANGYISSLTEGDVYNIFDDIINTMYDEKISRTHNTCILPATGVINSENPTTEGILIVHHVIVEWSSTKVTLSVICSTNNTKIGDMGVYVQTLTYRANNTTTLSTTALISEYKILA